jgi:hypothetical protein
VRQARKRAWMGKAVYFAECMTCDWDSGDTPSTHVAARAMDHARRNSHQVLSYRTAEYDFRRGDTSKESKDA